MILGNNSLTGRLPVELGDLTGIESLLLDFNDLEGPIPAEFGSLGSLTELGVTGNSGMSGALPASLTGLELESLLTGGTELCAPREPAFEAWVRTIGARRIAFCDTAMAYLTQAVQSRVHPVPLVAGEGALLRVFVTAARVTEEGIPLPAGRGVVGTGRSVRNPKGGTGVRLRLVAAKPSVWPGPFCRRHERPHVCPPT